MTPMEISHKIMLHGLPPALQGALAQQLGHPRKIVLMLETFIKH